jgi:hypothetical protein
MLLDNVIQSEVTYIFLLIFPATLGQADHQTKLAHPGKLPAGK